jgi:RNA polymerase sigma-70 factor, ECF subfamily
LAGPDQINSHPASDQEQMIARCKAGELVAFRQLVESNQQFAFSLAFRIVCNEDDARDIVQEAFIRVWKHIKEYDPGVKFTTWLYKIVTNLSYDCLKGEGRRKRLFIVASRTTDADGVSGQPAIDADTANRDLADKIKSVAQRLPLRQKMVFVLRDLQDLTVDEVADVLEISRESVKTNLCYARRQIRLTLTRMEVQG